MAEKRVSELTAATTVEDNDLFVMEQNGVAKKTTAEILKTAFGGGTGGGETGGAVIDEIDFTRWKYGGFDVTYSDGTVKGGSYKPDGQGRPAYITFRGHTLTLTFPEVE